MRHEKDQLEQWQKKTCIKTCSNPGAENWINHKSLVGDTQIAGSCLYMACFYLVNYS